VARKARLYFHADFLLGLFFDPEDGVDMGPYRHQLTLTVTTKRGTLIFLIFAGFCCRSTVIIQSSNFLFPLPVSWHPFHTARVLSSGKQIFFLICYSPYVCKSTLRLSGVNRRIPDDCKSSLNSISCLHFLTWIKNHSSWCELECSVFHSLRSHSECPTDGGFIFCPSQGHDILLDVNSAKL
jgi:hypothetical protein